MCVHMKFKVFCVAKNMQTATQQMQYCAVYRIFHIELSNNRVHSLVDLS